MKLSKKVEKESRKWANGLITEWKKMGVINEGSNKEIILIKETEIKLGSKVISLVAEGLEKLNKDKKLKEEHYTLYEKFCKEDN